MEATSMVESCASSPSVYASDSPSPAPSSSQTPTHHYANGYHHNGNTDFSRFGSPGPQIHANLHAQTLSQHFNSPSEEHQFIKRPLNAYMIWTVEERKKILAKDPKMKMNDVSRLMGEKWKTMSDKEKRPFFEMSKQSKLEHKRALKENPDLVYRPQRKKPGRGLMRQDMTVDHSPSVTSNTGRVTPATQPRYSNASTNGYQCQTPSQAMPSSGGTVLVAQPLGVYPAMQVQSTSQGTPMTVTFQTPQAPALSIQRNAYQSHQTNNSNYVPQHSQNSSANMQQVLDMYYTSLCQPAFPEPGETNNMAPPQYYLDQYHQLYYQSMSNQHGHVGVATGYGSYGAI